MKLALSLSAFPPSYSVARALRVSRDLGYEAIEVSVGEEGPIAFSATAESLRAIRGSAADFNLELCALTCASGWLHPLTHQDPKVRDRGIEATRRTLEIAHELAVDTIVVVPGKVNLEAYFDIAFANVRDSFQRLLPDAERLGVTIALENVQNNFLLSPIEVMHFLNQFSGAAVRACLNVGNAMSHGRPEDWIQRLGPRIQRVHMKDHKSGGKGAGSTVPLGTGDVNWPVVMRALRTAGYTGPLIAEVQGAKRAPETDIHEALLQLRRIRALIPA